MRRIVVVLLLASAAPAPGQEGAPPLVSDRPDFTESAATVPLGTVQLESGYTFARTGAGPEHSLGEVLLRLPVVRDLELRLGLNSFLWAGSGPETESGLEDASLGAKLRLADGGSWRPEVALIVATTVPTGTGPFREGNWQPEAKLVLVRGLSESTGLAANLNYAYASDEGERYRQLSGSLSLARALTERTGAYVEVFGFAPEGSDGSDVAYLNGGLTRLLTEGLQLDLRGGVGLSGPAPDYFVGAGFARRW